MHLDQIPWPEPILVAPASYVVPLVVPPPSANELSVPTHVPASPTDRISAPVDGDRCVCHAHVQQAMGRALMTKVDRTGGGRRTAGSECS